MRFDASRKLAFLLLTNRFMRGCGLRDSQILPPRNSTEALNMTDQLTEVRASSGARNTAVELTRAWAGDPRWLGVTRSYTAHDVVKLRGSVQEQHPLAERGARRLWGLLHDEEYINALGAMTGG